MQLQFTIQQSLEYNTQRISIERMSHFEKNPKSKVFNEIKSPGLISSRISK